MLGSTTDNGQAAEDEWKVLLKEPDLTKAANSYRRYMLNKARQNRELVVHLDIRTSEVDRERAILSFYKRPGVEWASPFSLVMEGRYI